MSVTGRCVPRLEAGTAPVMPVPMVIEFADPGGVICMTRNPSVGLVSTSRLKTELLRVEGLGAVHVPDRDQHELKLGVRTRSSHARA
jgi:hypothetical protein